MVIKIVQNNNQPKSNKVPAVKLISAITMHA